MKSTFQSCLCKIHVQKIIYDKANKKPVSEVNMNNDEY